MYWDVLTDMNTKHDVCWNKAKTSQEIFSHHMTEYPQTEDPLDDLRRVRKFSNLHFFFFLHFSSEKRNEFHSRVTGRNESERSRTKYLSFDQLVKQRKTIKLSNVQQQRL